MALINLCFWQFCMSISNTHTVDWAMIYKAKVKFIMVQRNTRYTSISYCTSEEPLTERDGQAPYPLDG